MSFCNAYNPPKKKYPTQKKAQHALGVAYSYGRIELGDLHTYHCPDCGSWHLGHPKWYQPEKDNTVSIRIE